jgi:predicted esterase
VLLPEPEERRAAAEALAARADVPLERWLELCRGFGSFEARAAGVSAVRVPLWTPEGAEETELWVYVPPGYDPTKPAPLLLQMHYTGGSGEGQHEPWRAVADALGMLVLAPSEPGANVGYTFTERERQATLSALRWARLACNVDENRIFASGISRGGHLAWDLALRHPGLFAGIAPMIGSPRIMVDRGENNVRYLENVVGLPIRDLQGEQDDEVVVHDLKRAFERLRAWGAADAELLLFPELGHWYELDAVDWPDFWSSCKRDPLPKSVVRRYARPGEGRSFWLEVLEADSSVEEVFTARVNKSTWEALDPLERLDYLQKEVDERTARVAAERTTTRIKLEGLHATRVRVLFSEEMLPPKTEVLLQWQQKTARRKIERDARVLLAEFVERFDRTFLPVFEAQVP